MLTIKNTGMERVVITGHKSFGPGETRKVTEDQADYLIRNENLVIQKKESIKGLQKKKGTQPSK